MSVFDLPDLNDPVDQTETEVMPIRAPGSELELASLRAPDLNDPVDQTETEVMPSSAPGFPKDRWSLVLDRGPQGLLDVSDTEVMPLAFDRPVLLRVRTESSLGLVAFERRQGCSPEGWPVGTVLLSPARELLALVQPGEYQLRSLQPTGAGWSRPRVEVYGLGGDTASTAGGR